MKKILCAMLAMMLWTMCPLNGFAEEEANHPLICISVRGMGNLYAELYPEYAPITVENFLHLIDDHFYDGLTFHRIISGFMIQGGDPLGNGTGGSGNTIKGEFSANGVENPLLHERGVLSMARSMANDSASSQFFIMHDVKPHLDGSYAAFGRVLAGMWIVDRICQETPVQDRNGTTLKEDQPVIETIRMCDVDEVQAARDQEKKNGAAGTVFQDYVTPIAFPVPEGWNKAGDLADGAMFQYGAEMGEEGKYLLLRRYNYWDGLSAAYKTQLEAAGYSKQDMDTEVFTRASLIAGTGRDESQFTDETHSDVLFYSAEWQSGNASISYFVGAKGGYIYAFMFNGAKAEPLFSDVLSILDGLTFRETF